MLPAARGGWDGLRVLVTAGGTREPIDPVRFIGNRSSGRMGLALAAAAARRGADVTLVAANVCAADPAGRADGRGGDDRASSRRRSPPSSRPPRPADGGGGGRLSRRGSRGREDLPRGWLGDAARARADRGHPGRGRAAAPRGPDAGRLRRRDGGDSVERARDKLERKGVDAIVVNDVSRSDIGFDSTSNEVTIVERAASITCPRRPRTTSPRRSSTGSRRYAAELGGDACDARLH